MTTGSETIANGVFAVGEQTAAAGSVFGRVVNKISCTVSGWFGAGCEEESTPVIQSEETDVTINEENNFVINRNSTSTNSAGGNGNNSDSNSGRSTNQIVRPTVVVNGITEAELERRLAQFRATLNTTGTTIIERTVSREGSNLSIDRIYDSIGETSEDAAKAQ